MTKVKITVKVQLHETIEIDAEDLMHQSIDDYMDEVRYNLTDYVDIDNGFDWEIE
tara:strand:- start:2073 stop:2237 length:165 start_codon:yes stop_codon:yes gene_type:complete